MEHRRQRARLGTRLAVSYILLAASIMIVFTIGTGIALFFQMRAQVEHFAVQDIETVEGLLAFTPNGKIIVRDDYHNHPESKRVLDHYVEVLAPDGAVLYRNEQLGAERLGGAPVAGEGVGGYSARRTSLADGTRIVLVSRRHTLDGKSVLIRLAQTEEPVWRALRLFALAAAFAFALVIVAATFVAWRMSRRILTPVQRIAARAEQITSNRLHERIPTHGTGDEIDQLAEVFNRTLSRLDESFRQLRQFTADASHELRTPLASLRAIGEVGLDRGGSNEEYRELIGSMLEEVSRLTRLVDDLLTISRGDAGSIQLRCTPLRMIDLVKDTVSILEPLADEKEQTLAVEGAGEATVDADPIFLRQALLNVIHNAIKYSPRQTKTTIRINREPPGCVTVSVEDAGPGISPEHAPHIFDRFYRADPGRSRDAGGFGLGLAITQWAVEAHKGSIGVTSSPGDGSTFRIVLPEANSARKP
ncbi:MAG TPA: ATP-binding protein [Bryobacteraceae bacterium]|jgi:heavy metal sensor kinase|nr:ATP-binding protein [Bryobacteraceae bacterium]